MYATVALSALLLLAAHKPSAVQVCFALPDGVQLFQTTPSANYKMISAGVYMLDVNLTFDGIHADRLTKNGDKCVRAWLAPRTLREITVDTKSVDYNFKDTSKSLNLKLKADLWHDAGTLTIERGEYSDLSTTLDGTLAIERVISPGEPNVVWPDSKRVARGNYLVKYKSRVKTKCEVILTADARGSIRNDNHPEVVQEVLRTFQEDYVPQVIDKLDQPCAKGQVLNVTVSMYDGVLLHPLNPSFAIANHIDRMPHYVLTNGRETQSFENGSVIQINFAEHWVISEKTSSVPLLDEEQQKKAKQVSMYPEPSQDLQTKQ